MKKFIYIVLLAFVSGLAITSCTEQEIKPKDAPTGGGSQDPKG